MKKLIGITLASFLVLSACGNEQKKENGSKTESINENKVQFKDDTLVIEDAVLTIKDIFIVNDKSDNTQNIAFKYEVKNKSGKAEVTALNVWFATMKLEQESEDTINKLEVGFTPVTGNLGKWNEHSNDKIKKGKSAKGIMTYKLQNKNKVILIASKGLVGEELGKKEIDISKLKSMDYSVVEDMKKELDTNE